MTQLPLPVLHASQKEATAPKHTWVGAYAQAQHHADSSASAIGFIWSQGVTQALH